MYNALFVDDDSDTLELLDSFFPKSQFNTFLEENLENARRTLERVQPDIVISDVVLSGETGFDFVKYIRSVKLDPIIFLITGYDDVKGEDAYQNDVHLFIRKPVLSPNEIVAAALRHLRDRNPARPQLNLSKRERQIISLIARGMTTQEISVELSISARTVAKHRENMLRKTQAKNIVDLVLRSGTRESQ